MKLNTAIWAVCATIMSGCAAVDGTVYNGFMSHKDSYTVQPVKLLPYKDLDQYKIDHTCKSFEAQYVFLYSLQKTYNDTRVATLTFGALSSDVDSETLSRIRSGSYSWLIQDLQRQLNSSCGGPNDAGVRIRKAKERTRQ